MRSNRGEQTAFPFPLLLSVLAVCCFTVALLASGPAQAAAFTTIQVEAEAMEIQWPMVLDTADDASGCGYLHTLQNEEGLATFQFAIPAYGWYWIWPRGKGASLTSDSFNWSLDGGDWQVWAIPQSEGVWTWVWANPGWPVELDAGTHTLRFRGREAGAALDRVEISNNPGHVHTILPCNDATWTPSPTLSATPTDTATPTETPYPIERHEFEAEAGAVIWPMAAGDDQEASSCAYVASDVRDTGEVSFGFQVTRPDTYRVFARAKGQGWSANSFWVSVDGGTESIWEINQDGGQWTWVWGQAIQAPLNPGPHTVTFRAREVGSRLDRLDIVNRHDLVHPWVPCGSTATPTATIGPDTATPTPTATRTATSTATVTPTDGPSPTATPTFPVRKLLPMILVR